jgi:hypothetical protein
MEKKIQNERTIPWLKALRTIKTSTSWMKVSQHNFASDDRLRKLNAMVQWVLEFSFHFMDDFG